MYVCNVYMYVCVCVYIIIGLRAYTVLCMHVFVNDYVFCKAYLKRNSGPEFNKCICKKEKNLPHRTMQK